MHQPRMFYLVQWMPGPITEGSIDKEFSIVGLDDIKEDYRYALDIGRITMATYRFRSGPNTATMHRLCKILYSGEKALVEQEMVHMMSGHQQPEGSQPYERQQNERIIYTIDDDDKVIMSQSRRSIPAPSRPPSWEIEKEMLTLLEENHKLGRENRVLKEKLAKSVNVTDLKNILETTIVNINEKLITELGSAGNALSEGLHLQETTKLPGRVSNPQTVMRQPSVRQASRMSIPSQQSPRQQPLPATSPVETDSPYIIRVQSLAEPKQPSARPVLSSNNTHPTGSSIDTRVPGYPTSSQIPPPASPDQCSVRQKQHPGAMQRQIRAPTWQANYIADGIVERLRNVREVQQGQSNVATSSHRPTHHRVAEAQKSSSQCIDEVVLDDEGDKQVELAAGSGVKVSKKFLRMAQRSRNFSQYTRSLMTLVFNSRELATCSVTGFKATGKGSENAIARPALDQAKVHGIIGAVQKRYPGASHFKVKQIMSQKLMDLRKTMRNKQMKGLVCKRKLGQQMSRLRGHPKMEPPM
ncbi:uncharacterized protein [Diadema antillarum]|uniref:uncharacterized protein n=1 Tax=Diadema antillarum TaxID=105358 RepID=UPI003A8A75B4